MTDEPQVAPAALDERADAENNKGLAIVGYLIPIIFFVPLVVESSKRSPFAKFHANQQLVLLLTAFLVQFVGAVTIPILIGFAILPLGWLCVVGCAVIGLIGAAGGQMKKIPVLGRFVLIK